MNFKKINMMDYKYDFFKKNNEVFCCLQVSLAKIKTLLTCGCKETLWSCELLTSIMRPTTYLAISCGLTFHSGDQPILPLNSSEWRQHWPIHPLQSFNVSNSNSYFNKKWIVAPLCAPAVAPAVKGGHQQMGFLCFEWVPSLAGSGCPIWHTCYAEHTKTDNQFFLKVR